MLINGDTYYGNKVFITPDGGRALRLRNGGSGVSVKGQAVSFKASAAETVEPTPVNSPTFIGVWLDDGVAVGAEGWVVTDGPALVKCDGNAVAGQFVRTLKTADADVAEVMTMTVDTGASANGDIVISLRGGTPVTIPVLATDTTPTAVATKIRAASFTGWTTGGTNGTVTFTAAAAGLKTGGNSLSFGASGANASAGITWTTVGYTKAAGVMMSFAPTTTADPFVVGAVMIPKIFPGLAKVVLF